MKKTLLTLLLTATTAAAQDVLTVGAGSGAAGGTVQIPVSVRDVSGTELGVDRAAGNRIQGIAFKVMFPVEVVQSVTFTRVGVIAGMTPLLESTTPGDGFIACIVSFSETANPIPFTLNAAPPGNQIGTLMVTLRSDASNGSIAQLRLDPPSATLSNQAGTVLETVAAGNLTIANGSVTVSGTTGPSLLVATASGTNTVGLTWTSVGGATGYEVQRRFNGSAFAPIPTPPGTAFSDTDVSPGNTYLYRVRANFSGGGTSGFSNVDAATTIVFADEPVVAGTTLIRAVHVNEIRTAVNAFRKSAVLGEAGTTVTPGTTVLAQHIVTLRTALNEARTAAGIPPVTFTDETLTTIKAVHIEELRNGVE